MTEMIQIVDENDILIDHKPRNEVDYSSDIYRVAALWLTNSSGEVLIAQRKLTKDKDPGKWGPAVAGTVDEGETYSINIVKETEEEIGLTGVDFERGPKLRVREPRNYFGQWFLAQVDMPAEAFRLQEDEVEQVKWVPKDELLHDVVANPDKYVPMFPEVIAELMK
jgi:isopentenyldiphosphate isomerase